MFFYIYLFALILPIAGALIAVGIWKIKNLEEGKTLKIIKVISICLGVFYFAFFATARNSFESVLALQGGHLDNGFLNAACLFLFWFTIASGAIMFLSVFHSKIKATKILIKFFVLPVAVLNIVFFYWMGIAAVGVNAWSSFHYRLLLMSIMIALLFAMSVVHTVKYIKEIKIEKENILSFILACVGILIISLPVYAPSVLLGNNVLYFKALDFVMYHRILIYVAFIAPALLFFSLRKKPKHVREYVCAYIAIVALVIYSWDRTFEVLVTDIRSWPFHLCNAAMYMLALTVLLKMKRLFYFTLFINVLGAFLAIALPDYNTMQQITNPAFLIFMQNHYIAFFMPFMCVALGIFERPKLKQFLFSLMGFAVYYLLVLFVNGGFGTDYFYMNGDFITDKLGPWAEQIRMSTVLMFKVGSIEFTFYPIYQLLYFLTYAALSVGMWFVYELCFQTADKLSEMFKINRKIKLDELALKSQLEGRSVYEPVNLEGINMIKIKGFYKKYGNSKKYAVEDANLEINTGEIFGFLGPNGAGKSTIIKSLVGIQSVTEGSIEICGYDIEKQSVEAKRNMGFVPDHYALYERLTGREYINYIADIYKVSKEDRDARINKYLDLFELSYAFDSQIKTYSHGMKQKIAIIAALIHNPKVWILDEPLTGLDPNSIFQVKETMRQHAREGNIVFFSSHIIDVVEKLCDRIAIISKGKILTDITLKELKEQGISLEDYYIKHVGKKGAERE